MRPIVYEAHPISPARKAELIAQGYGSMMEFVDDAGFWVFNQISNFAYTRYNLIHPEIAEKQQATEKEFITLTPAIDEAAAKLAWQRTLDWFNKYLKA